MNVYETITERMPCTLCNCVHSEPIDYYYHSAQFVDFMHLQRQWELAHKAYAGSICPDSRSHALKIMLGAQARMDTALALCRATPEHKAAFGW